MADTVNITVEQSANPDINLKATVAVAGPQGPPGQDGADGADGADGQGLPTGGTTGQILTKNSDTDLDYSWQTPEGAGDMLASTYDPTGKAADAFSMDNMAETTTKKIMTDTERTKLSGIEAAADVTDATNVAAAGAFMKATDDLDDITDGTTYKKFAATDKTKLDGIESSADRTDAENVATAGAVMKSATSTADFSFVADEDDMVSNSATKLPTQQSVKAYVDSKAGTGDVEGPDGSTTNELALFADATGKVIDRAVGLTWDDATNTLATDGDINVASSASSTAVNLKSGTVQLIIKQDNTAQEVQITGGALQARINPRQSGFAPTTTPDVSLADIYHYFALSVNITINAPIGNPTMGNKLLFAFKDNGTSRTITWNSIFKAIGVALPTATVPGKWTYVGAVYNNSNSGAAEWHVIAVTTQA